MKKPKKIVAYVHGSAPVAAPGTVPPLTPATIEAYGPPDARPGHYYVSARDGSREWWLLGPLPSHAVALRMVAPVKAMAIEGRPYAAFYSFGTLRANDGETLGSANKYFPEAFAVELEAAA